jgi:hypothetical protein
VLGKLAPEYDERTINFTGFLDSSFHAPTKYDFDRGRAPIPFQDWGAKRNNSDVIASQANQILRFGRIDQRRTLEIKSADITRRYRRLSRSKDAGDEKDIGLSALSAFRDWGKGWKMGNKVYSLAMYGEIDPLDRELLRTAIYVFRGIHFGLWLPKAVEGNFSQWEYNGENGEDWKPGGYGGTMAYCKAYVPEGYQILLWGEKIAVSNSFIEKYCDEAWIAVEALDYWMQQVLDMRSLFMVLPSVMQHIAESENGEKGGDSSNN